ncbi:MAG: hypothetical protein R3C11_20025 [Planctomycetaceae bacterium]
MIFRTAWFPILLGLCSSFLYADESIELSNHPQLFLDDYLIAKQENLRQEVNKPEKHPANPLIVQDKPWERRMMEVYGSFHYDDETSKYRCWYLASQDPEAQPEYFICYAESDDGISWEKPLVGEGPYEEHAQHNIVIRGGHGICVIHTPDDPDPNRQYKATGGDIFAWSPDGVHWEMENCRYATGKNDTGSSMVQWQGEYLWFVRNQEPETGSTIFDSFSGKHWSGTLRGVGLSVSQDFKTWTKKESILRGDERDNYPWGQPHALCVTPYGDVLVGLLPMVHLYPFNDNNYFGSWELQLAVSRDGREWKQVANRQSMMTGYPEVPGNASGMPFHPTNMLIKDDTINIYYFGADRYHGEGRHPDSKKGKINYGIGLATLPADRFVALQPYDWLRPGTVETKPLKINGSQLLINADVPADNLKVELANEDGEPLTGFDLELSIAEREDELRYRITWKTAETKQTLNDVPQDKPLVIRISIKDGQLYSFQVKP